MPPILIKSLFEPIPLQWGLRGDPFLWEEMANHFGETALSKTKPEFIFAIEHAFERFTGVRLAKGNSVLGASVFVERYAHGGMSSGQVSMEFWRRSALPLLCARYIQVRQKR
jgi:hypothetical protein